MTATLIGLLALTAYLGHTQLAHATPQLVPREQPARQRYIDSVITLLTAP